MTIDEFDNLLDDYLNGIDAYGWVNGVYEDNLGEYLSHITSAWSQLKRELKNNEA